MNKLTADQLCAVEKRKKLAQALKWGEVRADRLIVTGYPPEGVEGLGGRNGRYLVPQYESDLNALHAAVKTQPDVWLDDVCRILVQSVIQLPDGCGGKTLFATLMRASGEQLADAILLKAHHDELIA